MPIETIPHHRLYNQKIIKNDLFDAHSVVKYMGAVQAQDYSMAKWAIGLRSNNITNGDVEAALNKGEIVRTHVLRPTWHIVSGQDVRWMLTLTAPFIKASAASRDRDLGIDAALYKKTNDAIAKALEGNKHLTREEVMQALEKTGIKTDPSRAVHFMMNAECDALVCNGIMRGKEHTYALLDEKVQKGLVLTREEALATLAERYFTSHSPATLQDFQWWSGLPMRDARVGLDSIKQNFTVHKIDGKEYFFNENTEGVQESIFFLPAFDEYTVSYKDRSAVFDPTWHKEAITSNGIFKPIIVANGKVIGIWKRTIQKNNVLIETAFFNPNDMLDIGQISKATLKFGEFLGLPIKIQIL